MKKGYRAEYEAKKKLEKIFSKEDIFKLAIGGTTDFFVLSPNENKVLKLIEVKTTKKDKWYPSEHDKKQYKKLLKIEKRHKIPVEYWIKINGKWQSFNLREVKKFFV
jgi:hypothetical protein